MLKNVRIILVRVPFVDQLKYIPTKFGELVSLEYLNLSSNQLKDLPSKSERLKSLWYLDLRRNNFNGRAKKATKQLLSSCEVLF